MSSQNLSSNELARALEIAHAGEISRRSFLLNGALGTRQPRCRASLS